MPSPHHHITSQPLLTTFPPHHATSLPHPPLPPNLARRSGQQREGSFEGGERKEEEKSEYSRRGAEGRSSEVRRDPLRARGKGGEEHFLADESSAVPNRTHSPSPSFLLAPSRSLPLRSHLHLLAITHLDPLPLPAKEFLPLPLHASPHLHPPPSAVGLPAIAFWGRVLLVWMPTRTACGSRGRCLAEALPSPLPARVEREAADAAVPEEASRSLAARCEACVRERGLRAVN